MGISSENLNPQYVFVQATEPADKTQGKLWFDTSTNILYASNGTNYKILESDLSYINELLQKINIDVLRCLASASLTPSDYDTMYLDIFSDAGGYSNSIDTGASTTATFDTNKYINNQDTSLTLNVGDPEDTPGGSGQAGLKFTAVRDCVITGFTLAPSDTSTNWKLGSAINGNQYGTGTITNHAVTGLNIPISSGATIYLYAYGGIDDKHCGKPGTGYPFSNADLSCIGSLYQNNDAETTTFRVFRSIITEGKITHANKIIQTLTLTLDDNITAYQLFSKNTITGTGSAQFKISFDNGSTWSSVKDLDTKYMNATSGTSIKLQILLNSTGDDNIVEVNNYSLLVWY